MQLCVGAASRRIVEEAAKLNVSQVVASRRQVDIGGGYIGMDQHELVEVVAKLSGGLTAVVRDHGGPLQGGKDDDGIKSFDADVRAGFDGIHIDVSCLPRDRQVSTLQRLLELYREAGVAIEIGGETDDQWWLDILLRGTRDIRIRPLFVVVDTGSHVWADRQYGRLHDEDVLRDRIERLHALDLRAKCHNADWLGDRLERLNMFDAYNVAPEFGAAEVDAILTVLHPDVATRVLDDAFNTEAWRRWFTDDEGTWFDRARCAMRYVLDDVPLSEEQDEFVRKVISDAIQRG